MTEIRHKYRIIAIIQGYLLFTILYCIYGPIKWYLKNEKLTVFLVILYQIGLLVGYILGINTSVKKRLISKERFLKHIDFYLVIAIFTSLATSIRIVGSFSVNTILQNMINGIVAPAYQYNLLFTNYASRPTSELLGGRTLSLIITLGGPFTIYATIVSIIFYRDVQKKYLVYLCIVMNVVQKLIAGANEGIFDIGIYIFLSFVIKNVINPAKRTRKHNFIIVLVGFVILVLILSFFNTNALGRTKGNFVFGPIGENHFNYDSIVLKVIPQNLHFLSGFISVYLCQGYYGFSLNTLVDWVPNYLTGFSPFIRDNLLELFNINLFKNTYQYRVSRFGWGAMQNFHTAYTFWANDFTLYGVALIMVLLGYLLARTNKDIVINSNPYSMVLFVLLVVLVIYLPANNKIFVQPASFLLFFWMLVLKLRIVN